MVADGRRVAFQRHYDRNEQGEYSVELRILDLDSGESGLLLPIHGSGLDWSPDGERILLSHEQSIWSVAADGSDLRPVLATEEWEGHARWSPDGSHIAFAARRTEGGVENYDTYAMRADGTGVRRLTMDERVDVQPEWSSDGEWITFAADLGVRDHYQLLRIELATGEMRTSNLGVASYDIRWDG